MKKILFSAVALAVGALSASADVKIGDTTYSSLSEAYEAAKADDVIEITGVTEISSRFEFTKPVTIVGVDETAQIKRKWGFKNAILLLFSSGSGGSVIKNITISGSTCDNNNTTLEANNAKNITLENVKFIECKPTASNRVINTKSNAQFVLKNVNIDETYLTKTDATVHCGGNDCIVLSGDNAISVSVKGRVKVDDSLTNTTPIKLYPDGIKFDDCMVIDWDDASKFELIGEEGTVLVPGIDTSKRKVLNYGKASVLNSNTGKGYVSLPDAMTAVGTDGVNTLVLSDNIEMKNRFIMADKQKIVVTTSDGEVKTIHRVRGFSNGKNSVSFELSKGNNELSFSNLHFTNGENETGNLFNLKAGTLYLDNVSEEFQTSGHHVEINGGAKVFVSNSSLRVMYVKDKGTLTLNGNVDGGVKMQSGASVLAVKEGDTLTGNNTVAVEYVTLPEEGTVVVNNSTREDAFHIVNAGYSLEVQGKNLVLKHRPEEPLVKNMERGGFTQEGNVGDVLVITAQEGHEIWYKEDDVEPSKISTLSLADEGYINSQTNEFHYTVPQGTKKVSLVAVKDGVQSEPTVFTVTNGSVTGIEAVEVEESEATVEYYNLQGVRVANPAHGLYIRKCGNKAVKVVL